MNKIAHININKINQRILRVLTYQEVYSYVLQFYYNTPEFSHDKVEDVLYYFEVLYDVQDTNLTLGYYAILDDLSKKFTIQATLQLYHLAKRYDESHYTLIKEEYVQ